MSKRTYLVVTWTNGEAYIAASEEPNAVGWRDAKKALRQHFLNMAASVRDMREPANGASAYAVEEVPVDTSGAE